MITTLPALRPDMKGLVEKAFHMIQERYKTVLKDVGVIDTSNVMWGGKDYRKAAILNIEEFTKVVILCVLQCNSSRVLRKYTRSFEMQMDNVDPIPSQIWEWYEERGKSNIIPVDDISTCYALLPRDTASFTRYGLEFRGLTYQNSNYNTRCALAGMYGKEKVKTAFVPDLTDYIYLIENGQYERFELTKSKKQFKGTTYEEASAFFESEKEAKKNLNIQQTQGKIDCMNGILRIAQEALADSDENFRHDKSSIQAIKSNRQEEKESLE